MPYPGDTILTCKTCNAPVTIPGTGKKPIALDVFEMNAICRAQGFKFVKDEWFCATDAPKAERRVATRPEERARKRIERNKAQKTFIREEVEA